MGFQINLEPTKHIKKHLQTLLWVLIICYPVQSFANTFVVDDNYDGTNITSACEQPTGAQHFTTIAAARLSASTTAGPHTLRICPGTYAGNITFNDNSFVGMAIEGTTSDPSDVVITGSGANSVLYLRRINMTVRNLTIFGGRYGIRILISSHPSSNITLDNLLLKSQSYDGIMTQSPDVTISNTQIENSDRFGIYAYDSAVGLTVESSTITSSAEECLRSNQGTVTVRNVTLSECGRYGLFLIKEGSGNEDLLIDNVTVKDTGNSAVLIRNFDGSATGETVSVSNVKINNAGAHGLGLNNVDYATFAAISIDNSTNHGMNLLSTSTNNQFTDISISNSTAYGLYSNGADSNSFDTISIDNNAGDYGLYLAGRSDYNTINNFETHGNTTGIAVDNSRFNTITNGYIYNNNQGLLMTSNAQNSLISNNYINANTSKGLSILATGSNTDNNIYQNCFINASNNIEDLGTSLTNLFDNGTVGNFYGSLPTGSGHSETCFDTNNDTICDTTYTIPGTSSSVDNYPSKNLSSIHEACQAITNIPDITFNKVVSVISDPLNLTLNPKAIPGAIVQYTLTTTNNGEGSSDLDSIIISDKLPDHTLLIFGSPVAPIIFNDGSPASGIGYTFNSLSSSSDDIQFSNDGGNTFITPSVGSDGIDASSPPIDYIRINPKGALNPDSSSGTPNFTLTYQLKIL